MSLEVDPLPPQQTDTSASGEAPGASGDAGAPGAPADGVAATGDWSETDVAKLKDLVAAPYKKIADSTGDAWIALSDLEAYAIAVPMTSWLPVSWIRGVDGQKIPPLLGAIITAVAVAGVSGVRVAQWNRQHPDKFIVVPFIGARRGARRGPSTPTQDPRAHDGSAERPDDASDRVESAEPADDVPPAGARDGGPAADSLDDLRRAYAP